MKYTPDSPQSWGLPHQKWWSGQREGVESVLHLLLDEKVMAVMVNGPTGAGKSLVGTAVAKGFSFLNNQPFNTTVLTQTRDLQMQYAKEFPACKAATGRSNWHCGIERWHYANKCPRILKGCSKSCPYKIQRDVAVEADMRAINYAFYGATNDLFHAPFMITDEADYLGELLVDSKSVDLTDIVDVFDLEIAQGPVENESLIEQLRNIQEGVDEPEIQEDCKRAITLLKNKRYVIKGVGNSLVPWPESRIVQDFVKQPTLIMSATVFAPQYWSKYWGIPVGWVELPCDVPVQNRPIHLMKNKWLNKDTTEKEWLEVVEGIDNLMAGLLESKGKGVIHSVSNWLTELILKHSRYSSLMILASGQERLEGIENFRQQEKAILIGPNLTRGINLPDDQCRWIIIPKLPYPQTEDPKVKEMLKGGNDRYLINTLSTLIQASGRGIRHRNDYCQTFILDSGAESLFKRTSSWLPKWYKEAIIY